MVAVVAITVQIGALIALHLLPTGYNPVRDAISDYGIGRFRGIFWLHVVAGGVAGLALAVALARLNPFSPTLAVVMLVIASLSRFLLPAFPTDQGGNRFQTAKGTVHMLLAIAAFTAVTIAASTIWGSLRHYPQWHGLEGLLNVMQWVITATAIATAVAIRAPRVETDLRDLRAPLRSGLGGLGLHRGHRSRQVRTLIRRISVTGMKIEGAIALVTGADRGLGAGLRCGACCSGRSQGVRGGAAPRSCDRTRGDSHRPRHHQPRPGRGCGQRVQ